MAAHQASLSFTVSQSLLKLMSTVLVVPSSHLILSHPLLLLPSIFSGIGVFPMNWFFASGGQSIGASASASVLPMNIQGLFPLGLTGLIILIFNRLSRVFFSTRILFSTQSFCGLTLTSIHNYWKNHSFGYTDLCQQSDISAF